MKRHKKISMALLVMLACILYCSSTAQAYYYDHFAYKDGVKMYSQSKIVAGNQHYTKNTKPKKSMTQYQIVKMGNGKIVLRPQAGWHDSEDPYFQKRTVQLKLASNCKFYYRNVSFPFESDIQYRRVTKRAVRQYMKEMKIYFGSIEDVKGKYYTSGYFGDIYVKNGKVVAVLTDGGD